MSAIWLSGDTRMPTASEFAEMVFRQLVWPAIETVMRRKLGWLAKPFLAIYRRVFERASKKLVAEVESENRAADSPETEPAVGPAAEPADSGMAAEAEDSSNLTDSQMMQRAAGFIESIGIWVDTTRGVLSRISSKLRWFVVGPLYVGVVITAIFCIGPLFIIWWMVT